MKWFRENRFLGGFFIAFSGMLLLALWFFFDAKSEWNEASSGFTNAAGELNRLERLAPYPSTENLRKMKAHAEDYSAALAKLKDELKRRAEGPPPPMAPNEFQSRLRLALNAVTDKARANKVRLPDKFYLGFNDYVSTLPIESAAPSLGRELTQIEWLVNNLLVESDSPAGGAPNKLFQRDVVEATFSSTPGAARKVINQIAAATQPFCIVRLLHVRNENDKGPPRDVAAETSTATKTISASALNFIVGNEKIETTATIEIVRFTL
jgi:hypothetical protein